MPGVVGGMTLLRNGPEGGRVSNPYGLAGAEWASKRKRNAKSREEKNLLCIVLHDTNTRFGPNFFGHAYSNSSSLKCNFRLYGRASVLHPRPWADGHTLLRLCGE